MMIATAWTDPGNPSKPSEDWFGIADRSQASPVVVLDGGTARTDTGCVHGVAWYAEQLGLTLLRNLQQRPQSTLVEILAEGISSVAALHQDTCDLSHPGTPSAAVGLVRPVGPQKWEYAVLGDVTVILGIPDDLIVVADRRISESAKSERAAADIWPIGSPEKDAAMVAMKHVELAERNRSYWIAAADPEAAKHALTGEANEVIQLAVLTDGAARACLFGLMSWSELLHTMGRDGPARIIQQVRSAETSDPEGRQWPRNKKSDDATAVHVGPVGY